MDSVKRIPDDIFEEMAGFTDNMGKPHKNISQKEFDKKYNLHTINKFRIRNAGEAFFSTSIDKIYKLLKKEKNQNLLSNFQFNANEDDTEELNGNESGGNIFSKLIQKFLSPFIVVINFVSKFKKIFKLFSKIAKFFKKFVSIIVKIFKGIIRFIGILFKNIFFVFKKIFSFVMKIVKIFISIGKMIIKAIGKISPHVKKTLSKIFRRLIPKFKRLVSAIKKIIKPLFKLLKRVKRILFKFARKFLIKLGTRLAVSAAVSATGVGAPIGVLMTIGSTLLAAWDLYDVYKIIKSDKEICNELIEISKISDNIKDINSDINAVHDEDFNEDNIEIYIPPTVYRNKEGNIIKIDKNILEGDTDAEDFLKQTVKIIKNFAQYSPEIQKILNSKKTDLEIFNEYQELIKMEEKDIIGKTELLFLTGSPDGSKGINLIEIWQRIIKWIENNIFEFISTKKIINNIETTAKNNDYIYDSTGQLYKSDTVKKEENKAETLSFIQKAKVKTTDIFEPFFNIKTKLNEVQNTKTSLLKTIKITFAQSLNII